jgi:SAM-dependent methyltransferase
MLDAALAPDSPERLREHMLQCYRATWQFPELGAMTSAFGDFITGALQHHASRVDTAVDLGCAAGACTPWLLPYSERVFGVDLHFERVRAALEDHDQDPIRFLVANAEDPPFADASVGLVLWLNLLDSIARPRLALQGLLRILPPGGLVFFSSPFTYASAVSEPSEWVDEVEFDEFVQHHFDVLAQAERLPWVVPAGPRRADVFLVRAALLRKRG